MIVLIKQEIAKAIEEALTIKARLRTSRFNEQTENRPQKDVEIGIYHLSDSWVRNGKATYVRNYRFSIEVAVKNLRTDDEIQNLVDLICFQFLVTRLFGHELIIEKVDNNGIDNESIWRYLITVYVGITTDQNTQNCDYSRQPYSFDEIAINLYPSYTKPLIEG